MHHALLIANRARRVVHDARRVAGAGVLPPSGDSLTS